jgi:phosphatidyl-myo-inositol dimannoside synthase
MAKPIPTPQAKRSQRLLLIQNSSLFEGYGGIEYYQDDFLQAATEAWGKGTSGCVVLQKKKDTRPPARPYHVRMVPVPAVKGLGVLVNRYWPQVLLAAKEEAARLRPTMLLAGHVSLAPLVHLLHRWTKIPYGVIAYGIECWGDQWPQDHWAMKEAAVILSISEWTKAMLVKQGIPAAKIRVVHPPLPSAYEKLPSPRRPRATEGPFTLLTISRLEASERYKGQDHVLQALYRLRVSDPELKFRYIIQGDGSDRPRLEALVEKLELQDTVEFRGAVSDRHQFETAYREADLYVMPSRFGKWDKKWKGEGFGIVYLEAAAFGLPSIAYDCGGATDIIRHGVDGWLVVPDSITELANVLAQAAQKRDMVFEMGKKAHENVMSRFTRAHMATELESALRKAK